MTPVAFLEITSAIMAPMWVELSFLVFFVLGFAFMRMDRFVRNHSKRNKKWTEQLQPRMFDARLRKTIEAEAASGKQEAVLKAWRMGRDSAPTPPELLELVVQALMDLEPKAAAGELMEHLRKHAVALGHSRIACGVLNIVARAGQIHTLENLWEFFQRDLHIKPTCQMYEILIAGFASVGDEKKVAKIFETLKESRMKLTARGYSLTIKGFLKNNMVDAVLKQLLAMNEQIIHIPPFAIVQFVRISCEANRAAETFRALTEASITLPPEAVSLLLEDRAKHRDLELAIRIEALAREAKQPLLCGAYDALLKLNTSRGHLHALELFEEMQTRGIRISEGLCVGLLSRCADSKFLRFAEAIIKFCKAKGGMTIAVYSALMKVYAYCNMYDKACDLYDQICADGLEPDSMMYGCLMKFSVECGRTKLSRELSEKAPCLDIHNYMSLIRAAGRDRDVNRAFAVLEQLRVSNVPVDIAAYNCVLNVCVCVGDLKRACELVDEIKSKSTPDVITYNTLLKGYCTSGNVKCARALLVEMEAASCKPNDVSFNCLLNASVSSGSGNLHDVWELIDMMEKAGVAVDNYTMSILLKAVKSVRNEKFVTQALQLLDKSGLDVCADEILLNNVLETCIRHRDFRRLESILTNFTKSGLKASLHTYAPLIKASAALKNLDQCWALWHEMVDRRAMVPNDLVLGCMLDALVCSNHLDEALDLFRKWKSSVPGNTVLWSTLIKGFANTNQSDRAMDAWHEMRNLGIKMNTVAYNAVIDAQARVGAMDAVSKLVETMATDGCTPDSITFSTIVKGYCVKGDLDKAFDVFSSMQTNRMVRDSIAYNTLLDGCLRQGRTELADDLLEDMDKRGVVPSNYTLGILVRMYGRRRQLHKALEVVKELPARHGFQPNSQVRVCLMCTCINNNALDTAFEVFEDVKKHSHGIDAKAYGTMISGCIRYGRLAKAVELVDEAYGLHQEGGKRTPPYADRKDSRGGWILETETLEHLLHSLAKKGMMEDHGVPLLDRLRAAKAPVIGRLFASAMGGNNDTRSSEDRKAPLRKGPLLSG